MSVAESRNPELGAWSSTEAGEPFGEWQIPGMGESHPTCEQVRVSGFCAEEGHLQYQHHHCGRRECPYCWSSQWAEPRTVSVIKKLAAIRYEATDSLERRLVHTVVSPPEDSINTIEAFYKGRSKANDIAREHGVRGGVTIAHGYRVHDEVQEEYRGLDRDIGIWIWLRENDRPWREQVYWSPHYHIIGLSRDVKAGGERADGYIFERIRSLRAFDGARDREAYDDMAGAVRYLLSHATFPGEEDRQSVTWFGALHPTNFSPEEELSDGAYALIERVAEEVVGAELEEESGGTSECSTDGCESRVIRIWRAPTYNMNHWSREARERVVAAYDWASGKAQPPPGLKNPSTIKEAEEVVEHLVPD